MRNYYIFRSGRIRRKDNTIFFETQEGERIPLPINDIDSVYLFGEVDLNTKLLNFLSQNNIMVHFFNYYGFYTGTFYPKEFLNSGEVVVRQVEHYLDKSKRLLLAKEFVRGAIYGSIQNLKRYKHKLNDEIEKLTQLYEASAAQDSVEQLMGIEGNAKDLYYSTFEKIIEQDIDFKRRVKNPPDNMMNALISFVNSIIYSETLKEIYKTQLNPTISYLHEPGFRRLPGFRRFSLSLDVSEIFKPIFGDRVIFELLNDGKLNKKHFDKSLNFAYLLEEGRRIVVQEIENKLNKTILHKQLKRRVSYRRLIRLELYKLIKHLLREKVYKSFRIWW